MTVGELIAKLQSVRPDAAVVIEADWGPIPLRALYASMDRDMVMFTPFTSGELTEV